MNPPNQASHTPANLHELGHAIWTHRKIFCSVALSVTLLFAAYAFFVAPTYRAEAVLRPPALNELDAMNRSGFYSLTPSESLEQVARQLNSYANRLKFSKQNASLFNVSEIGNVIVRPFEALNNEKLKIRSYGKRPEPTHEIVVTLDYSDGENGVEILNRFIEFSLSQHRANVQRVVDVIIKNRTAEVQRKIERAQLAFELANAADAAQWLEADAIKRKQLLDELAAQRVALKGYRLAKIQQLEEAIRIASELKLSYPATRSTFTARTPGENSGQSRAEINSDSLPLYFMGVKALEAERATLKSRKSDDFASTRVTEILKELRLLEQNRRAEALKSREGQAIFMGSIKELKAELHQLEKNNFVFSTSQFVSIDRRPSDPERPLYPRKLVWLITGGLLGIVLGSMAALVCFALGKRQG